MRSLAILLLLASCTQPSPSAPEKSLATDLAPPMAIWADARVVHAPLLANVSGGLPSLVPPKTRPIAGRQFLAQWTTRPTAPFPDLQCVLIVSSRPAEPRELAGADGGMLMVHPDQVFLPDREKALFDGFLTQEGGVVGVNVTFPPAQVGAVFYAQLLVQDPRSPRSVTVSPMLRLTVGNR